MDLDKRLKRPNRDWPLSVCVGDKAQTEQLAVSLGDICIVTIIMRVMVCVKGLCGGVGSMRSPLAQWRQHQQEDFPRPSGSLQ